MKSKLEKEIIITISSIFIATAVLLIMSFFGIKDGWIRQIIRYLPVANSISLYNLLEKRLRFGGCYTAFIVVGIILYMAFIDSFSVIIF